MRYHVSYSRAVRAATMAAKNCGWKRITFDSESGIIKAKTRLSLRSWGEEVTISVKQVAKNSVSIELRSEPVAQLIDWGRGDENRSDFLRSLNMILKEEQ